MTLQMSSTSIMKQLHIFDVTNENIIKENESFALQQKFFYNLRTIEVYQKPNEKLQCCFISRLTHSSFPGKLFMLCIVCFTVNRFDHTSFGWL